MTDRNQLDTSLQDSSFGTDGAKQLRSRTPDGVRQYILQRADELHELRGQRELQRTSVSVPARLTRPPVASPPAYPADSPRPPEGLLGFIDHALEDWQRTLRLVVLVVTATTCIAALIYVIQLRTDEWIPVAAAVALAIASLRLRLHRLSLHRRHRPTADPYEDSVSDQEEAGSIGKTA
jgi:hypothetical protein